MKTTQKMKFQLSFLLTTTNRFQFAWRECERTDRKMWSVDFIPNAIHNTCGWEESGCLRIEELVAKRLSCGQHRAIRGTENRNPKRTGEDCHAKRKIGAKTPLKKKIQTAPSKPQKKSAQNTTHKKIQRCVFSSQSESCKKVLYLHITKMLPQCRWNLK